MKKDIPNALEKYFGPLVKELIKKAETLDPKYFGEMQAAVVNILEKHFQRLSENGKVLNGFINFIKDLDVKRLAKEMSYYNEKQLNNFKSSNIRVVKFIELLDEVDRIKPNMSIVILLRVNLNNYLRKIVEPYTNVEELNKSYGEHKARMTMRFFREVFEYLYDNYIRILWEMVLVLEGKNEIRSKKQKPGQLINNLVPRLEQLNMSELIEPIAATVRNAATHVTWKYNMKENSITVWDTKESSFSLGVEQLIEKAKQMNDFTGLALFMIFITRINEKFYKSGFLELLFNKIDMLLKEEIVEFDDIEKKVTEMFQPILEEYKFIR